MKKLLKKSLGEQILRVDELLIYFLEAAAVMNSRPLAPESSETHSSDGVAPLTPAHFLTGGPVTALPSDPDPAKTYSYSKRWSYLQRLTIDLWRRWKSENLLLLQKCFKWKNKQTDFSPGDIVLLKEDAIFVPWPE